ncbi:E3 ubiquitin-protein ligase MARCHF7 isoform X2 [Lampetra fluviatilis]
MGDYHAKQVWVNKREEPVNRNWELRSTGRDVQSQRPSYTNSVSQRLVGMGCSSSRALSPRDSAGSRDTARMDSRGSSARSSRDNGPAGATARQLSPHEELSKRPKLLSSNSAAPLPANSGPTLQRRPVPSDNSLPTDASGIGDATLPGHGRNRENLTSSRIYPLNHRPRTFDFDTEQDRLSAHLAQGARPRHVYNRHATEVREPNYIEPDYMSSPLPRGYRERSYAFLSRRQTSMNRGTNETRTARTGNDPEELSSVRRSWVPYSIPSSSHQGSECLLPHMSVSAASSRQSSEVGHAQDINAGASASSRRNPSGNEPAFSYFSREPHTEEGIDLSRENWNESGLRRRTTSSRSVPQNAAPEIEGLNGFTDSNLPSRWASTRLSAARDIMHDMERSGVSLRLSDLRRRLLTTSGGVGLGRGENVSNPYQNVSSLRTTVNNLRADRQPDRQPDPVQQTGFTRFGARRGTNSRSTVEMPASETEGINIQSSWPESNVQNGNVAQNENLRSNMSPYLRDASPVQRCMGRGRRVPREESSRPATYSYFPNLGIESPIRQWQENTDDLQRQRADSPYVNTFSFNNTLPYRAYSAPHDTSDSFEMDLTYILDGASDSSSSASGRLQSNESIGTSSAGSSSSGPSQSSPVSTASRTSRDDEVRVLGVVPGSSSLLFSLSDRRAGFGAVAEDNVTSTATARHRRTVGTSQPVTSRLGTHEMSSAQLLPSRDPERLRQIQERLLMEDSDEEEGDICRICQMSAVAPGNLLVVPCSCTGSLQYVHQDCMRRWLEAKIKSGAELSAVLHCELCKQLLRFEVEGFDIHQLYQEHSANQAQSDFVHSGLYLVLLLHLCEQRFNDILRNPRANRLFHLTRLFPRLQQDDHESSDDDGDDDEDDEFQAFRTILQDGTILIARSRRHRDV